MLCKTEGCGFGRCSFEVIKVAVLFLIVGESFSHVVKDVLSELLSLFVDKVAAYPFSVETSFIHTDKTDCGEVVVDGMFVAIGLIPQNEAFSNVLSLDERGYADSSEDCKTPAKGIFVAGDCRKKDIRQVTTAVSDGAVAALAAIKYLEN